MRERREKRGQIASQIFIYILGIIVIGLILLLGFRAIQKLDENKCTVQYTQFVTDLSQAIEKNKGWGINRIETFTLPCDVDQVCFVDRDAVDNDFDISTISGFDAQFTSIAQAIVDGDNVNIFTHTANGYNRVERFEVSAPVSVLTPTRIRCVPGTPASGTSDIKMRFKGQGRTVEVDDAGSS